MTPYSPFLQLLVASIILSFHLCDFNCLKHLMWVFALFYFSLVHSIVSSRLHPSMLQNFLFQVWILFHLVYITLTLSIDPSVGIWFFPVFDNLNNSAINMCVQLSLQFCFSVLFWMCYWSRTAGFCWWTFYFCNFMKNCQTLLQCLYHFVPP